MVVSFLGLGSRQWSRFIESVDEFVSIALLGYYNERNPVVTKLNYFYEHLHQHSSRAFVVVLQQLDGRVRDAVCVFYLVLHGLDALEESSLSVEKKLKLFHHFPEFLKNPGRNFEDLVFLEAASSRERLEDKPLFDELSLVQDAFFDLHSTPRGFVFQDVIADFCRQIVGRIEASMKSCENSDVEIFGGDALRSSGVASLIGVGVHRLFETCGLEDDKAAELKAAPTSFVQRCVEIRQSVLQFDASNSLEVAELAEEGWRLIEEALRLLPLVLSSLSEVRNPTVFRFVATPVVMALGTVSKICSSCFTVRGHLSGGSEDEASPKISPGTAARILLNCNTIGQVACWLDDFVRSIQSAAPADADICECVADVVSRTRVLKKRGMRVTSILLLLRALSAKLWPIVFLAIALNVVLTVMFR